MRYRDHKVKKNVLSRGERERSETRKRTRKTREIPNRKESGGMKSRKSGNDEDKRDYVVGRK